MTTTADLATRAAERTAAAAQAAKDRLARLMATENITVEHDPRARTAMFNVETRTLIMPVWRDMPTGAADMLIAHEVSHALHTPAGKDALAAACARIDPKRLAPAKDYLNVTEDVRIERLMKARFPGTKGDFAEGYRWMLGKDLFGIKGKDLRGFALIDRVNLHYKIGWLVPVPFTAEELPLAQRVAEALTFDDAVEAAKAIYEYAKAQAKRNPPPDEPEGPEGNPGDTGEDGEGDPQEGPGGNPGDDEEDDVEADGDDADGDDGDDDDLDERREDEAEAPKGNPGGRANDDEEDDDEAETGATRGRADDADDDDADDDDADDADDADDDEADGDDDLTDADDLDGDGDEADEDEAEAPVVTTAQNVEDALQGMTDAGAAMNYYVDLPKPDALVVPRKETLANLRAWATCNRNAEVGRKAYLAWREDNLNAVNLLGTEFDRRKAADEHRRTFTADTGTLDPTRLAYYRTSDEVFLTNAVVKDGKNHGVVLLLDLSGSMTKEVGRTVVQMVTLAHFCRRANIPFQFYGFTDRNHMVGAFEEGNLGGETIAMRLVTLLENGMTQAEFVETCGLLLAIFNRRYANGMGDRMEEVLNEATAWGLPWWALLGGTPTNGALLGMVNVAEEFKRRNNLQVVNVVVLTDGEPTDDVVKQVVRTKRWKDLDYAGLDDRNDKTFARIVLRDPVTRKTYPMNRVRPAYGGGNYYEWLEPQQQTVVLAQVVRDRIGGKVICIHLRPKGRNTVKNLVRGALAQVVDVAKVEALWLRENWCAVKGMAGYDEYITIATDGGIAETKTLGGNAATAAGLRTLRANFKRNLAATKANRPLLARVADLLARK